jgi:hypothetical protein
MGGCIASALTGSGRWRWWVRSYDIRIVPFINNPACAWLSGEYLIRHPT